MNAVEEPQEDQVTMSQAETKKQAFPTVLVAGLGILVLALTAAAGLMCFRSRGKTADEPTNAEQELPAAAANASRNSSESGSPKSSTEDSK